MFKKLLLGLGVAWVLWLWSLTVVNAQLWWNFGDAVGTQGIWVAWTGVQKGSSIIDIIKSVINRVLWLLSLIVLVLMLYGWFKMITAAGDETKYKEWFKVLKQAAIWLAVIWLAWFIVSIVFWIITQWTTWF